MRLALTALALLVTTGMASAEKELALVIGNSQYRDLPRLPAAIGTSGIVDALRAEGVRVIEGSDLRRASLFDRLRDFDLEADNSDAIAMVLVGQFTEFGGETWFLPVDAEGRSMVESAEAGVPLSVFTGFAARHAGRSIIVLGTNNDEPIRGGVLTDLPDGVTVVNGTPSAVLRFVQDSLARRGGVINEADDVTISGYVPPDFRFLGDGGPSVIGSGTRSVDTTPLDETPPERTLSTPSANDAQENFWRLTVSRNTEASYEAYIDRYVDGRYVGEAQERLRDLRTTDEERFEISLGLTREQKQDIQRDLSLLGYDTRGIDGIFGPGTRGAIRTWQQRAGFGASGFMSPDQISTLRAEASERADVLEAEERSRREDLRRRDEEYWSRMGAERDENELRDYLDRFPDGLHSDEAVAQLNALREAEATRGGVSEEERALWQGVQAQNTVQGYRDYLAAYPNGPYAQDAKAQIDRQTKSAGARQEAEAAEQGLGLNQTARLAIETRLQALGHEPGAVDGVFDDQTRAALRRFQQASGLPATGYVNQFTAVRLLTDALRSMIPQ
ncbi:peptidoglycan-binding domain-containing protein [Palleronia caenipelagi]|uniref:Peptidoglycan binding-like domain-containing protein n=1 Tax=Palleronia caenipelagi TaxID=2489174 RepID=A0A547Q7A4_9RHOB|nr:peptidoglycan-binding protein [Palleronia caenipelagi]TRD22270.1 hypothetical protein FEV53_05995 [Palleronia caenipelagi]